MMTAHASARFTQGIILLGWTLLVAFSLRAALLGSIGADVRGFQAAYGVGFVGYALLVWIVCRRRSHTSIGSWPAWLIGCAVLRLTLLATTPSDDSYRYLWEGRVQLEGFNPYVYAPTAPQLEAMRDESWAKINHPNYPAIYGPVAEAEFLATAAVSSSLFAAKYLHALWDLLAVAVLAAILRRSGYRPHRAIVYGLCPLVLTAFAIEGHIDSLMLLFVTLMIWAAVANRFSLAGAALGMALATKIVAVVLLPWFAFKRPRACLIALVVAAACYLPYAAAGRELFASLTRFSGGEFFSLLGALGMTSYESNLDRLVVGVILAGVLLIAAWRTTELTRYAPRSFGALILLMPIVHYWYVSWVLVLGGMRLRIRWLAFALAAVLCFEADLPRKAGGEWTMPPWVPLIVWGCFLTAWVGERYAAIRRRAPTSDRTPAESRP